MDALDVARLMHRLFSAFDAAITSAGLFKMDTVGDAYVAAGFFARSSPLSKHPACRAGGDRSDGTYRHAAVDATATTGQVCDRVLRAARDMITAVAACREETGRNVHCRIGVSVGEVLAGVLGHLQPRFHIFGTCLSAAERHEKAGQIDTVHASPAFMAALALEAHHAGREAGTSGLQAPAAAAAALESGSTGSSGRWGVQQSELMDLLPAAAGTSSAAAGDGAVSLRPPFTGGPAAEGDPAKRQAFLRAVASSFRISFRSANSLLSSGDGPCDAAEPPPCAPAGALQCSFILRPLPDPGDCTKTAWADPGRRLYHATATPSHDSVDGPPSGSPRLLPPASPRRTQRSRSFGAEYLLSPLLLLRGGSMQSADVCFDTQRALARSCPGPSQQPPGSVGSPVEQAAGATDEGAAAEAMAWRGAEGAAGVGAPVQGLALEARLICE
jgi:class 3 adenylate cyclase